MNQLSSVEANRVKVPPMLQDGPVSRLGGRRALKDERRSHAFIRLVVRDFERRHGIEATEKLKQQLVDLTKTELFPGDEIADFGNGQLCILLRNRHQQHVLFVAQSLQYFLQGTSLHDREHNITVSVSFFDEKMACCHPEPLCKIRKEVATSVLRPESRAHRVTVLSDEQDLSLRLERSLSDLQINIMHVETIDQADTLIDFKFSDMTIVDINGANAWPGLVFEHFNSKAEHHHVLLISGDAEETRYYRERSAHAVDILPIQLVDSPHLSSFVGEVLTSSRGLGTGAPQLIEHDSQKPTSPRQGAAA